MSRFIRLIISCAFVIIIICAAPFPSQEQSARFKETAINGSLAELRTKHRVWLIVHRSALLDAQGTEEPILSEVYKGGTPWQNYPRTYNLIAKKLNKYMQQHQSISSARTITEAEFIIYFNVLEIRRPLGVPYAYGELFIILNEPPHARIIWKTKGHGMFAEDAVSAFISDLKAARGEG